MKRFFLSIMALCLCAVMSFAGITLPYSEDFESYGNTVVSTLSSTSTNKGYYQNVKVPTGWVVGNNTYSATDASPVGGAANYTQRGYYPFICTNGTSTAYASSAAASYQYATSGLNCLKMYCYYSSTASSNRAPAYAILPQLDASVNLQKVVITGKAKISTTSTHIIEIGVLDSVDKNLTSWVTIGQFGPGKGYTNTSDPVEFEANLKNYQGTGRYLGFRTLGSSKTSGITAYLDDIYVYEAACDAAVPSIAGVTDKTAQIALDIAEGYFDIKVMEGVVAAKDVEEAQGTLYDNLDQRPYTINDLLADKQYTVAVRMWCDEMGSTKSVWKVVSFKTLCTYATLDAQNVYYKTGFEDAEGFVSGSALATKVLPCWEVGNASPGATYSNMPYVTGNVTYSQGGDKDNHYLYMYTTTTYPKAYAVLPAINPENGDWSKVEMSYKMTCSTTASYNHKVKIGIMNNPLDPSTFVEVAEKEINVPTVAKEGWQTVVVTFENMPKAATGNCIAFMMNYENATSYAYIDDVNVHKLSDCAAPNSLEKLEASDDTCAIAWNGKAEKQYLVKWALEKVADEDKAAYTKWAGSQVVTGPQAVIKGLKPNTAYYFTVQTVCGQEEYSEYSADMLLVRTECPEAFEIPYFNDFNSNSAVGSGKNADCWTGLEYLASSTSTSFPYVIASKGLTGTGDNAFYLYGAYNKAATTNTRTYAIAPKMNVADLSQYMVRFYVTNTSLSNSSYTYKAGIVVGVTSDPDETKIESNFVALDTIVYEGTTYQQFAVDLSKFAAKIGAAKYVVLKSDASVYDFCEFEGKEVATNNSYAYIDNFEIVVPPCCVQPSIAVAGKAGHSLTVEIDPYKATDSQWQLAAVAVNAPSDTLYFTATTTTYEMTGLQPGTIYNIYARTYCASCGEGMYSDWTNLPVQGRTKDYYVDSYFFGFEDEEGYDIPAGATSSYKIHPALTVGVTKSTSTSYLAKPYQSTNSASQIYAKTGKAAMRMYNYYFTSSEGGSSSTSYYIGQYVILPSLDECSAQKRSIRFNYRQGYHYPLDYATASYQGKMNGQTTTPLTLLMGLVPKGTTVPTDDNFTLLQEIAPQDLTGKVVTEDEQFWETMIYNLTQAEATDYQVCLWWPQDHNTSTSWYIFVDDVQMTEAVNFEIPTITSCIPTDVAVNVAWEEMTNAVNVYVYDGDQKVGEALNVTENKATVTGLSANTSYLVKVVDATVPSAMEKVATVTREVTTECPALVVTDENPALFTFDENIGKMLPGSTTASDSIYLVPDCWYILNNGSAGASSLKGYNWIVQRQGYSYLSSPTASSTYDNYCFGMKDTAGNATNSLRLYGTTTASYKTAYAVLPRVSGKLNEYVLDFYFRPASLNMTTGKLATISTEKKFYVVAMRDVNDLSTADTLYTVEYPDVDSLKTSSLVANDPKGLEYWREFVLPLDKAAADARIAFVQSGVQSCYLFVDNVMIRKPGAAELFTPSNLNAENITKDAATLTWESANVGATYLLSLEGPEGLILDEEEVNGLSYNLTGLTANTPYTFSVKAKKGEYTSEASQAFSFNTACPTYGEEDFVFSFEPDENLVQQEGATSEFLQNSCWIYENLGSTQTVSSLYFPYNHKDVFSAGNKTNTFSHSGDYCLDLYASRGTTSATPTALGRVITPEIEGAAQIFSQKVLKFYYRAIYHNSKTGLATTSSNGVTYGRGVIVGVCSDPNDEATFQTLDTLYYTLNPTSADMTEANDYAWMKGFVKLDQAVGNRIWMMPLLKDTAATTYAYGRMYIDDMSFSDPMPVLTTGVNDQTMGKVTAGDAYAAGDPVTVEATANYNYKFVNWSDGATENPYTFSMPASDYTITANFAPKAIKVSDLEGESFENETTEGDVRWVRVPGASADSYRQIAGWVYSNAGTSAYSATNYPYNIVNTFNTTTGVVNNQYSRTGDYALRVYSAANETYRSYVATPEISDMENLAGKQIEFYMRPLYCYGAEYSTEASRNKVSTTYATDTYSKAVIVGTCSDPKDPKTFHPLKTVFYSKNVANTEFATEANNYFWEKQVVSMANVTAGDKYIYFEAGNKNSQGAAKACYMYIDDIAFGAAQPTITVESSDIAMGTVTGGGSYDMGSEVTITAEAKYNHEFVEWNDGNTDASRTITVEGDATYTAEFALSKFNAADINETFEAEEGGVQRWTLLPGTTTATYKATEAWTYGNIGTGTVGGNWPYNVVDGTSKYSYQGTYAAKLYATSTTYCGYIVTPKIEDYETAMEEEEFSFYMKPTYTTVSTGKDYATYYGANYAKTVIVGVTTDPNDVSKFVAVDTITYDYDEATFTNPSADNNYNWQRVTLSLKGNKAPYVYIMASRTDATGKVCNYDYMYVDNISFITPVTVTVETEDALKGSAVVVGNATVAPGQEVTIKAVPEDTYVFDAWKLNGTVVSNDIEYTFALTEDQTYMATFKREQIAVNVATEGNGTANINDTVTAITVEKYATVTLNAVADQGYQFVQWTDGNQDNPRQITVTEAKTYTATFAATNYKILVYVDSESDGMGTVAAASDVEGPAVNMYYAGTTVTLTATAEEGYVFDKWNDGNKDNPRQITASAEVTYYASFMKAREVIRKNLVIGNYYTLCEDQDLTKIEGGVFYLPEIWNGTSITFAESETVGAGRGYLFQATAEELTAVKSGDKVSAVVAAADNKGMQGALVQTTILYEGAEKKCGISGGKLMWIGEYVAIGANRAYIVVDAIDNEPAPAQARRLSFSFNKPAVVTSLENVVLNDNAVAAKYIIDGQLVIVKDGKYINAQGQILK